MGIRPRGRGRSLGASYRPALKYKRVDPEEVYGVEPSMPAVCWGWGALPDQYGRRWADDDGESPPPTDAGDRDLPPILPEWRWRTIQP